MKKRLYNIIILFCLFTPGGVAQTAGFHYEAPITPVDSSGFYNIVLTPELNAHLKIDYSDLRVVNDAGKWVPHLVRLSNSNFSFLPVQYVLKIKTTQNSGGYTDIIIEGVNEKITSLNVSVNNTTAERFCSLTGSDDLKSWFTINDSILMKPFLESNRNTSRIILEFPPVEYKYYKIHIVNNNKAPLNIREISAGPKNITTPEAPFYKAPIENPTTTISQKDSGKTSLIKVEQLSPYHFNVLSLKVNGAKHFNRTAELYIPFSANHSFSNPGRFVQKFAISNNSTLEFTLQPTNAKVFYILIHNDDNPVLKVEEVKTSVGHTVATVYLEKTKRYKLLLDNSSASVPKYDLSLDDIPYKKDIPSAIVGKVVSTQRSTATLQPKPNSKKLIWAVIAIAAVVLTFFTYRLVTDMNKSKS